MAQPPAYNREKNFTLNSGRETDHAALNAELDRASNSINDIRSNLAILQADDGKLRPAVVTSDSISHELRVSLVEGVVMDAQSMLERSLAAADSSSASALAAKASEERAASSSVRAVDSAEKAAESAKTLSLAINADWTATEGAAKILNKPELSQVALTGSYGDLTGKPEDLATVGDLADLQVEMAKRGIPVGSIEYFAMAIPPSGYLKADGAAVGRETYPELFAAIGTTFGAGDGSTTFNLPDLIDRFPQGSMTPGLKLEAGLPNIEGYPGAAYWNQFGVPTGAFYTTPGAATLPSIGSTDSFSGLLFSAGKSNSIYGASNTVQPPALTLLPCIKAFDAASNPGLIDITGLANDVTDLSANKLDKTVNGTAVKYVTETYNDGRNWYRKWSDGWLEQGARFPTKNVISTVVNLVIPFCDADYMLIGSCAAYINASGHFSIIAKTVTNFTCGLGSTDCGYWYACGKGV